MTTPMRSPDGREAQIKPAGVAALTNLGWKRVEPPKPARTTATPGDGERAAPVRKPRKSN